MSEQQKFESAIRKRQAQEAKDNKRRRKVQKKRDQTREAALAAVDGNRTPRDLDQCDDLDVRSILDPNEAEILVRIGKGPPMRMKNHEARPRGRVVSLRDDLIGRMAKRRQLGENETETSERLAAARELQRYYERATIGGARGIDPSRDIVDGGCFEETQNDQMFQAQKTLKFVRERLGIIPELHILGARLLEWVLSEQLSLALIAEKYFERSPRQLSLGTHFKRCLDIAGVVLRTRPDPNIKNGPKRERDRFDIEADVLARCGRSSPEVIAAARRARKSA
jgi:hypothetical protein